MKTLLLVIALRLLLQQPQVDEWNRADPVTVRLEPDVFSMLPVAVRSDLKKRTCTIPQPFTSGRPQNVIRGRFFTTAGADWAVLCSRDRISSILVYRGGSADSVVELNSQA